MLSVNVMSNTESAVVIGGSHAAVQLVISLRQNGWEGSISIISDEPHLPYHRPPLSKAYLAGDISEDQLALRASAAYEKLDVSFKLGVTVVAIDTENRQLQLDSGETVHFSKLALCTGARARPLAIAGADGFILLWDYLKKGDPISNYENFHKENKDSKGKNFKYFTAIEFTPDGTEILCA